MADILRGEDFRNARMTLRAKANSMRFFAEDLGMAVRECWSSNDQYYERHHIHSVLQRWDDTADKVDAVASLPLPTEDASVQLMHRHFLLALRHANPTFTRNRLLSGTSLSAAITVTSELFGKQSIPQLRYTVSEMVACHDGFNATYFDKLMEHYVDSLVGSYARLRAPSLKQPGRSYERGDAWLG